MSQVISFPGVEKPEEVTPEKVFETVKAHKLSHVIVIGVLEDSQSIIVAGNATTAHGVYLAELGKMIIIQKATE